MDAFTKPTVEELLRKHPDAPAIGEWAYVTVDGEPFSIAKVLRYGVHDRVRIGQSGWIYDLLAEIEYQEGAPISYLVFHDCLRKITPEEQRKQRTMNEKLQDFKFLAPK